MLLLGKEGSLSSSVLSIDFDTSDIIRKAVELLSNMERSMSWLINSRLFMQQLGRNLHT